MVKASWLLSFESIHWLQRNLTSIAPLLLCSTALLAVRDVGASPALRLALLAAFALAFLFSAWKHRQSSPPVGAVLGVALVLRVLALPLAPTLSDDVYRYIWDGRVAIRGFNPYSHAPDSVQLEPLRDELWEKVAHRDVETVYPPLAISFFSIASLFERPVLAWKGFLLLVDTLSCLVLLALASRWRVPRGRTLAYLWNPLVVVEVVAMGHVDGLGVLPLLVAAWAMPRASEAKPSVRRIAAAALSLGLAVLTKLVPLVLIPLWARHSRRSVVFVTVLLAVVLAACVPVLWHTGGVPPGLVTYGISWEFNGPIYEPLWRTLDLLLEQAQQWSGRDDFWESLGGWTYPRAITRLLLSVMLFSVMIYGAARSDLENDTLLVLGALILASATVYPWYLLWLLPFAALSGSIRWLLLSVTMMLSYVPQFLSVPLFPWIFLLIWSPFVLSRWIHALSPDDLVSR